MTSLVPPSLSGYVSDTNEEPLMTMPIKVFWQPH